MKNQRMTFLNIVTPETLASLVLRKFDYAQTAKFVNSKDISFLRIKFCLR